jgi:hypothetical protein
LKVNTYNMALYADDDTDTSGGGRSGSGVFKVRVTPILEEPNQTKEDNA